MRDKKLNMIKLDSQCRNEMYVAICHSICKYRKMSSVTNSATAGPNADTLERVTSERAVQAKTAGNSSMPGNVLRKLPTSWSSTLSLPKSSFPARPIVADRAEYLKRCSDDLYAWQRAERSNETTFTLHDGPPYANGELHVGHALNKILKDITCRFQLSQGRRVDWVPGWDCHGLPIEQKALQQGGEDLWQTEGQTLSPLKVRDLARTLAASAVENQKASFQKWGIMADWENAWKTMDKGFELKQLEVFKKFVGKGLISRRFKPVWWSPSSRTALAESELEYKEDHVSVSAFVKFPLVNIPSLASADLGEISAVIWTTTPWTVPANKAIGVHSDLEYCVAASQHHGNLLIASSRVEAIQKACKESLSVVATMRGDDLVNATYQDILFVPETRRFLHAEFVSADSGSGLVHLAPGHGKDDYQLCLEHKISATTPVDDGGCFTRLAFPREPSLLEGKPVLEDGNEAVLNLLYYHNLSISKQRFKHKYPYDWRSKQPVITRATSQWFADVEAVQWNALRSLEGVQFVPETGKERLSSFIRNRSEWCISRQRAWGVPIPVLYNRATGDSLMTEESISHIIDTIQARGIDAWWADAQDHPVWTPSALRSQDGKSLFVRGKDTMDVWFDSGTSWTQAAEDRSELVAPQVNVYLEGSDQHRGWFQSSLLTYIASQESRDTQSSSLCAPFRTLITHGFTMDDKGLKMSKSIGNVVSPKEIMDGTLLPPLKKKSKNAPVANGGVSKPIYDAMGPDALRLWIASSDFTKDVSLGQTVLKAINGCLSKYRVTFKLLLGLLQDYQPISLQVAFDQLGINHQIVLMQLRQTRDNVIHHNSNFEYNKALHEINNFVNTSLSALYIETIKDAMYADKSSPLIDRPRAQAQYTLLQIFRALQDMLAPVTPLLVEEVWDYTPETIKMVSIHPLRRIFKPCADNVEAEEDLWHNERFRDIDLPVLMRINDVIKGLQEQVRSEKKMGSSLQSFVVLQLHASATNSAAFQVLQRQQSQLATLFVVSKVSLCVDDLPGAVRLSQWRQEGIITISGHEVKVHVYAPINEKCVRCWQYAAPVDKKAEEALCSRCEDVIVALQGERPELFAEHSEQVVGAGA